jgi:hypothetical protein
MIFNHTDIGERIMKRSVIISIFLLATGLCQVCRAGQGSLSIDCVDENGRQKTENRVVDAFDSVDIKGSFSFIIDCGHDYGLEITCDRNLLPFISTEVKNQKLFIFAQKSICATNGIKILITSPAIRSIDASGSNTISIKGIDNQTIAIRMDGSGEMHLSGNTKNLQADLAGSNLLDAKNLRSEKTSISIAGSSDASVNASAVLDINISGVGDLTYYGNPKTILKNISGIGKIEPAESTTTRNAGDLDFRP